MRDPTNHPREHEPGATRAEEIQLEDADDAAPAFPVGVVTGSQARGAVLWGAAGAAVGALIGMGLAFIPLEDVELVVRLRWP